MTEKKSQAAPRGGDTYSLDGTISKGGVAIQGPNNTISIQQYFSGLSPEERARQEAQLRQSVSRKITTLQSQSATPRSDLGNPYYSTEPLGIGDKNRLCGRESFLAELIKRLQARQITFLCGNGGVGKTSLIQAGVIPALVKAGHLPLLVTAGSLPLDRCIKEQITDTDLAQKMGLRSFLEFVSGELEETQAIFILVDRLEEFFEQGEEEQQAFKVLFEVIRTNLPAVHWLFSIHTGASYRLGLFEPEVDTSGNQITLAPLNRTAAAEAIQAPAAASRIRIEDSLLEDLLNKLGRDWIDPAQLQLVCFELAGGTGSPVTDWTYPYYESLGKVEGILQNYLVEVIDRFLPKNREPAWEILACLSDRNDKCLNNDQLFAHMDSAYRVKKEQVVEILDLLKAKHLVDLETRYRLSSASLEERVQKWLAQRSIREKARDEVQQQVRGIGASALRGLLGGAIGFGLAYICLPYVGRPTAWDASIFFYAYNVALRALFGGMAGFAMVLAIDLIAASFTTSAARRLQLSMAAGGLSIGFLLATHTFLGYFGADWGAVLLKSAGEGAIWGALTGAGIMLCLERPAHKWLITVGISLACGIALMLADLILGGLAVSSPLSVALAGVVMPLFLIGSANLGKHTFFKEGEK